MIIIVIIWNGPTLWWWTNYGSLQITERRLPSMGEEQPLIQSTFLAPPPPPSSSSSSQLPSSSSSTFNVSTLVCTSDDDSSSCENMRLLPHWMQDYFQWHHNQLYHHHHHHQNDDYRDKKNVGNDNNNNNNDDDDISLLLFWKTKPLLIVRCLDEDRCGGTADRLKGLPLYLAVAAQTKRLLFIRWTRPFPLESFFLPHMLNWTIPDSLTQLLLLQNKNNKTKTTTTDIPSIIGRHEVRKQFDRVVRVAQYPDVWLVEGVTQTSGGDELFHKVIQKLDPSMSDSQSPSDFFHDMFLALFRPSPSLYNRVENQMNRLNLRPNQFITAHIRAKYPGEPYRETWNSTLLQQTVIHAIQCASTLSPTLPIYVAGDTIRALEMAHDYSVQRTRHSNSTMGSPPPRIVSLVDMTTEDHNEGDEGGGGGGGRVGRTILEDPPHLNFANRDTPDDFFSIFTDLILMSQSRCVAFGVGGFGRFGSLASFNSSCRVAHSEHGILNHDCYPV